MPPDPLIKGGVLSYQRKGLQAEFVKDYNDYTRKTLKKLCTKKCRNIHPLYHTPDVGFPR